MTGETVNGDTVKQAATTAADKTASRAWAALLDDELMYGMENPSRGAPLRLTEVHGVELEGYGGRSVLGLKQ